MKRIKSFILSFFIAPLLEPALEAAQARIDSITARADRQGEAVLDEWKTKYEEALEVLDRRGSRAFKEKIEAEASDFLGTYRGQNLITDAIKEMDLGEVITHYMKEECDLAELFRAEDDLTEVLTAAVVEKLSESLTRAARARD